MGRQVVQAVDEAPDMVLVGGADPAYDTTERSDATFTRTVEELLETTSPDVMVDFTIPSSVMVNARIVLKAGIPCVIGTTGLTETDRSEIDKLALANNVGALVAPNFAVGAVLMMEFARRAARYFDGVEIIELHHDKKADSPSGTALMTAGKIAEAWRGWVRPEDWAQPARGQEVAGVRVHSVRLPGLVAHQEVLLGNPGEALTIRHDSFDRKSFMPGVLLGVRRIIECEGLVYGLESFLFD